MLEKQLLGLVMAVCLVPAWAATDQPELNPNHPEVYVVRPGDTLWDISATFLVEPWRWPEIWQVNPGVQNPHLIYPGDQLALVYQEGRPLLELRRRGSRGGMQTVKLTPHARVLPLDRPIPTIPIDAIGPFLTRPRVMTNEDFVHAPYIVSVGREHLLGSTGIKAYVQGIRGQGVARYAVYRRGQVYVESPTGERSESSLRSTSFPCAVISCTGSAFNREPKIPDGEILGFEAIHVGDAVLERLAEGEPATVLLTEVNREVQIGDSLFPLEDEGVVTNFIPRPPKGSVDGNIIAVFDGVSEVGENQVVVLNLGLKDGMAPGIVLAVYQSGGVVPDPREGKYRPYRWWYPPPDESQRPQGLREFPKALDDTVTGVSDAVGDFILQFLPNESDPWQPGRNKDVTVTLPDERAGTLMVFRPFERVSYALVMSATRAMHVRDAVKTP